MPWMALVGALPALALMIVVDLADAKRPEPRAHLRKIAALGALAVGPCLAVQLGLVRIVSLTGVGRALFDGFVSAALIEEGAKALVLWFAVAKHPAFDERLDGIVYGTRIGLGFAMVENVLSLWGTATTMSYVGSFFLRAVFSVPCHAISAGVMGAHVARRRFDRKGFGLAVGLPLAIVMHGAYDASLYLASLPEISLEATFALFLVPPLIVVAGFAALRVSAHRALELDDADPAHRGRRAQKEAAGFVLR
jgi:RsiW-degrading membrane proteinase PrsW (M82 family)